MAALAVTSSWDADVSLPEETAEEIPESVGQLLRRQAGTRGAHVYAEAARSDRVLTFADVERWRMAFAEGPCVPGSTVALSIADPLHCAAALVGAVAAGLWVAPLDPATPDEGPSCLVALTTRVGARLLVTDQPIFAAAHAPCPILPVASLALRSRATAPTSDAAEAAAAATAAGGIVLSSSGTTGPPKVMRLPQRKLIHTACGVVAHHGLDERDRGFNPLPLFHINAEVVGLLSTLVAGSCLVLDDRFHRTDFWALMGERRVTWVNAVPAIISRLADLRPGESVPAGIRFVRSASAPLPVATADRFEASTGLAIVETYGMTEAASQITAHPLSTRRRAGSVGLPVGLELRVVRDGAPGADVEQCLPDEVGQVEIRGASVIEAYEGGGHADRFRVADGCARAIWAGATATATCSWWRGPTT
jgi:acyl-CoA synthetase (AMP-forming)/AMP-acid ligase II